MDIESQIVETIQAARKARLELATAANPPVPLVGKPPENTSIHKHVQHAIYNLLSGVNVD